MKKTQLMALALGAGLALGPAVPALASTTELEPAAMDAYLTQAWKSTALPGMSVVVTHRGRVVHAAGKLTLDEPVVKQLPDFRMADPRDQTSGITDATVDLRAAESAPSPAGYVAALGTGKLAADPGTRWAYSNANYETAARLVEVCARLRHGLGEAERERRRPGGARGEPVTYTAVEAIDPRTGYGFAVMTNSAGLCDDTYDVLTGLVAMSQGKTPQMPGGDRQLIEMILGVAALAAAGRGGPGGPDGGSLCG